MTLKSVLGQGCLLALLVLGCGAPEDVEQTEPGYGQTEEAITSQGSQSGGRRISGYIQAAGNQEGVNCVSVQSPSAQCILPRTPLANVCFTAQADADSRIRAQMTLVASSLNNLLRPPGVGGSFINVVTLKSGTTACSADGVQIHKAAIADDGLGIQDIRHYANWSILTALNPLSEPTPVNGVFFVMGTGNNQSRIIIDTDLIDAHFTGNVFRDRAINHALAHHIIRRFGLGLTGSNGAATHMSNAVVNDNVVHNTLHPAQTCLAKNLDLTNTSQYVLSNGANCPAFPNGM